MITIRRLYDKEKPGESYRVLVDRFWPRGVSKDKAGWNEWMREVSPAGELCKWFSHDPGKWPDFKVKYKKELSLKNSEIKKLKQLEKEYGTLTLLYSAKDEEHNNAVVLREFLTEQ